MEGKSEGLCLKKRIFDSAPHTLRFIDLNPCLGIYNTLFCLSCWQLPSSERMVQGSTSLEGNMMQRLNEILGVWFGLVGIIIIWGGYMKYISLPHPQQECS